MAKITDVAMKGIDLLMLGAVGFGALVIVNQLKGVFKDIPDWRDLLGIEHTHDTITTTDPVEALQRYSDVTGETYFIDPALNQYPTSFFDCIALGESATACKLKYPEGSPDPLSTGYLPELPEIDPQVPPTVEATYTPRTYAECYGDSGRGAYSIGDFQLCLEGKPYKKGY